MLSDIFTNKSILGGIALLIIVAGGCYFWYQHSLTDERKAAVDTRKLLRQWEATQKADTKSKVEQGDTAKSESFGRKQEKLSDNTAVSDTESETDLGPPHVSVVTSSNPLFADGVPKHLQCPEELVGIYTTEVPTEALRKIGEIANEVVEKYNPNRPLPEVWPQFIEVEKYYHANADPAKKGLGVAANRFDWGVQSILDFPEIVILLREDPIRASDMMNIDQGDWDPNWNLHNLPDGREFRTDNGFYYEFIYTSAGDDNKFSGTIYGLGHSGKDAKRITIDLNETTDEELERLGGWNYNINPYTTGVYKLGDNK